MRERPEPDQDENILDQLPYVNELMRVIASVNESILQGKDAREAAENLLSDLPDSWRNEVRERTNKATEQYNKVVSVNNHFLVSGYTASQKHNAEKAIFLAGREYARQIKMTVITLLDDKNLLFKKRKEVDRGSLSLAHLCEPDPDED